MKLSDRKDHVYSSLNANETGEYQAWVGQREGRGVLCVPRERRGAAKWRDNERLHHWSHRHSRLTFVSVIASTTRIDGHYVYTPALYCFAGITQNTPIYNIAVSCYNLAIRET